MKEGSDGLLNRRQFLKWAGEKSAQVVALAATPGVPLESTMNIAANVIEGLPRIAEQQKELDEKEIRRIAALRRATVFISGDDGLEAYAGSGFVVEQNGAYYIVTSAHVVKPGCSIEVKGRAGALHRGFTIKAEDWQSTPVNKYDSESEQGLRYIKIPENIQTGLLSEHQNGELMPLYPDDEPFPIEGTKIAIVRADLPSEDMIQIATLSEHMLKSWQNSEYGNTETGGENGLLVVDDDGQAIMCHGMSGSPAMRVGQDGRVTNKVAGVLYAIPQDRTTDELEGYTDGRFCDDRVYLRSIGNWKLTDSNGQEVNPLPSAQIESWGQEPKVRVIEYIQEDSTEPQH